jgi:hypothetical protein
MEAKSTMHHAKAMMIQMRSARWTGFHHTPLGDSKPVFMGPPGQGRGAGFRLMISYRPHPV